MPKHLVHEGATRWWGILDSNTSCNCSKFSPVLLLSLMQGYRQRRLWTGAREPPDDPLTLLTLTPLKQIGRAQVFARSRNGILINCVDWRVLTQKEGTYNISDVIQSRWNLNLSRPCIFSRVPFRAPDVRRCSRCLAALEPRQLIFHTQTLPLLTVYLSRTKIFAAAILKVVIVPSTSSKIKNFSFQIKIFWPFSAARVASQKLSRPLLPQHSCQKSPITP